MRYIWKGPGALKGLDRSFIAPGSVIPPGHITDERIEELGDRIERVSEAKPKMEPKPAPEPKPAEVPPKRKPGRPRGSNKR